MIDVIPVLLYHSVEERPRRRDRRHTVSPAEFAAHADAVVASGRTPLCITELATALRGERDLPDRPVAITFDDGYANTYEAVMALLRRELSATVYVTTGGIAARNRLSPFRLAELANLPFVEVGAHAVHHWRLDELCDRELVAEVRGSKAKIEQLTQVDVNSFAYPHGAYDQRVRAAVIAAGYTSAAAVKNAVSHSADDAYAIARWTVTAKTPAHRIAQVLEGVDLPRAGAHERRTTRAYRMARRQRRRITTLPGRQ